METPNTIMLSKDQAEKFKTIQWLTNPLGSRGSGRTYLLALSFIVHSLNYRTWVTIYDHGTHPYAKKDLIKQIELIIFEMGKLTVTFKGLHHGRTEILITPKEKSISPDKIVYERK